MYLCRIVAASVAIAFLLTGCAREDVAPRPVEIKVAFWGAPDEIKITSDLMAEWEKTRPDIKVKLEHTPYRGYVDKLLTRIAGRSAPDIICTEVDLFVTFQSKGVLRDITPYIAGSAEINTGDFYPEVMDRFTVSGKLYALPRDTAPFACVYYNKKLFDEAGLAYPSDDWDTQDLLDAANKLTRRGDNGRTLRYGFYAWAWQNFVYAFGGALVDDVKNPVKCALNSEKALEGLRFYRDLIQKYKVHPSATEMANLAMGVQGMFMTGRLAMFSSGIWETPGLRKIDNFDWDVAMFPKGPGGERGFGTGGSGYSILKSSEHPDEAFEVLKALCGKDAQRALAATGLTQPAIKDIARVWADDGKRPKNKKMLLSAVEHVIYDPFTPAWREAKGLYITPALERAFSGKEDVKTAIDRIIGKVNELIKGTQYLIRTN